MWCGGRAGNLVGETAQTATLGWYSATQGLKGIATLQMCTTITCTNMTQQLLIYYMILGETTPMPTMAPTAPTLVSRN